jgi:hypothetical protein
MGKNEIMKWNDSKYIILDGAKFSQTSPLSLPIYWRNQ